MSDHVRVAPPFGDQTFDNFQQWVNRASSWLTCHPEYNDTQHAKRLGWNGRHFTALCFDSGIVERVQARVAAALKDADHE